MTRKIFLSICLVSLAVLISSVSIIMGVLYNYFSEIRMEELRLATNLCAELISVEGTEYFEDFADDEVRITWINKDGSVLFDSVSDESGMENHMERDEVKNAFSQGIGESIRYSDTLTQRSMYCALLMDDGTVIRLSSSQNSVVKLFLGVIPPVLIVFVIVVLISLILAYRLTKHIVKPLSDLNLDDPAENGGYEELSPLLSRLDSQQTQLRLSEQQLRRKRDELEVVTDSMNEGLVLLNDRGVILSINPFAASLLGTDRYCVGRDILSVNPDPEIRDFMYKASRGTRCEKVISTGGGEYRFDASPVISDGETVGFALLMFDVTEQERSEQMRREFTANVSHELKTPLHSISGYAELISNGMVKADDVGDFAEKIYLEAQRMIRLVEDIIRLSRLDEGSEDMKWEKCDLLALAEENVRSLMPGALSSCVSLSVEGESAEIECIPRLVSGIIFNLCDNGIKYNRRDGSVKVEVKNCDEGVMLRVSDTGIGIMKEDLSRIFERFYRVDKSRSKEVGGTGLGLSIVKHAAKLHSARIDIDSEIGKGTCVSVIFPKK